MRKKKTKREKNLEKSIKISLKKEKSININRELMKIFLRNKSKGQLSIEKLLYNP